MTLILGSVELETEILDIIHCHTVTNESMHCYFWNPISDRSFVFVVAYYVVYLFTTKFPMHAGRLAIKYYVTSKHICRRSY